MYYGNWCNALWLNAMHSGKVMNSRIRNNPDYTVCCCSLATLAPSAAINFMILLAMYYKGRKIPPSQFEMFVKYFAKYRIITPTKLARRRR